MCRADLSNLDEVTRQNIISIIQRIDEIPSADEIDARIAEFEATEDYEGEELWMTQTYQQIASVYAGYAQLSEELQAYVINRDKLLELEYIWSVMPLVEATIRLDGTNGDLIGLYGAPNESYTATVGQQFTLPTTWQSPTKHNYKLRGWYQINAINDVTTGKEYDENLTPNDCYYLPGQTITVTGDMIFYADWMPTHYNIGENNDRVVSTVSTNDFVTTHLFDYSSIFNMYSSKYVDTSGTRKGYSEEWTALDHGQRLPNGKTSYGIILRDWDDGDQNVGHHLSKPSNFTNYAQFNTQGTNVTTGLMSKSPSLKDLFFNPSTTFRINENQTISGVLGTHYVGTADHLFQYDNNKNSATYGYYYYDSSQNAAAYNQSEARFYVYNYEEETQSSSSKDGQFLPFNSPYVDKPQHTNGMYVYDHKNSLGAQYSGANFWFGMRNEIHFYLPNDSGSTTSNLSMQGKQMEFRFSGDDDVWIYVDNELVLDIGGLHEAKSGTINFSTGVVKLGNTTITLNRKENEPAFCAGEHTLTMYYMERGATMSNCSIYFNLSPRFKLTLNKVNSDKQPLTGSEFQVFMDADCQTAATLWHTYDAYLVDLKDNQINSSTNVLNVAENGTASIWGFSPGNTYYIKETVPPDSSGYILPNGLIMVVLDSAGNATYSAVVIEDENGPEENNPSPGYEVLEFVLNESSHTMTLTIQNSYPSTELSVSKVWEGVDAESVPDSVQIELLAQYGNTTDAGNAVPTVVDTVALDKDNNWQHTWTKLPKFHTTRTVGQGGAITIETKEITYSVCEIEIQGFEASISPVTATSGSIAGYVVTNTAIPDVELTSLAVEKMWLDRNGEPADENLYNDLSVRIKLMADGEYSGQFVDLSKANNWTHTFINLPETDTDNNPIAYSVEEDWQNSDWTSDVAYDETRNVWDVTNTYSRMLTIEVEKSWVASAVPSSITIQLYEVSNDGAGQLAVPVEGGTIELKAPDWKGEFKVIPPDEKGVTYYIYEPTYSFAAEYDSPAKIYTYASNGETETTKQIDVGEVTVNDETGDVNTVSIINYAMEELPNTGGAGTASYTAGGLLITAAALLLMYFSKKRPGMKDAQSSLWDYPK